MCFSPQRRAIVGHQNVQKCSEHYSFWTFSLPNVPFATAACIFLTSERPKVLRRLQFFHIFTSKCAFRHSGVQFFDGWRAKSASDLMCFVHFHFKMCFSPQARTIFQHQNVPKWSKHVMFCTFWLANVLFTTAACIFLTSELTKSAPNTSCFVHFDFRMCFSPQRRAIFAFSADNMTPHPPL